MKRMRMAAALATASLLALSACSNGGDAADPTTGSAPATTDTAEPQAMAKPSPCGSPVATRPIPSVIT